MSNIPEIRQGQSIELLKELHILTRDGKLNQDTRRKLKQVYHLYQFIEPLLKASSSENHEPTLVDHGAGKSYLGFILYDLFFKERSAGEVIGIEFRPDLIEKSRNLAQKLGFKKMKFLQEKVADSIENSEIPQTVDIVTALHACDTATDDAIRFGLRKNAKYMVLVPCCQAEMASALRKVKGKNLGKSPLTEIYRHSLHTREFGSHLTNVLRCLELESQGYQVTVTELIGWEHSMKNELIIAEYTGQSGDHARKRLEAILTEFGLEELRERFIQGRR